MHDFIPLEEFKRTKNKKSIAPPKKADLFDDLKNHLESWRKQCAPDTAFDYVGIEDIIKRHSK